MATEQIEQAEKERRPSKTAGGSNGSGDMHEVITRLAVVEAEIKSLGRSNSDNIAAVNQRIDDNAAATNQRMDDNAAAINKRMDDLMTTMRWLVGIVLAMGTLTIAAMTYLVG